MQNEYLYNIIFYNKRYLINLLISFYIIENNNKILYI